MRAGPIAGAGNTARLRSGHRQFAPQLRPLKPWRACMVAFNRDMGGLENKAYADESPHQVQCVLECQESVNDYANLCDKHRMPGLFRQLDYWSLRSATNSKSLPNPEPRAAG